VECRRERVVLPDSRLEGDGRRSYYQPGLPGRDAQTSFPSATAGQYHRWGLYRGRQAFSLPGSGRANGAGSVHRGAELAGGVEEITIAAGTKLGAYEIVAMVGFPPSPITSRVPSLLAAYRMPACHGRRTDCLPIRPLALTYARCDHRQRRNTHPIRAS
jgi:hypothetical protein